MNHQVRLAARPSGRPGPSTWDFTTEPVPTPNAGEFVVAVSYLSVDPAMRRWIDASYWEPVEIGAVMEAGAVGRVISSQHPNYATGDHVYGAFGVQEFACSNGIGVTRLDPLLAPLPTYLGTLGITGLTAYFGLLDVGRPHSTDTVLVSGAAGAVGSVAGQIAIIKGCRVIGIAGGPAKCRWITADLGFDAAVDYKGTDVGSQLGELAPDGVDVFLDNVGGDVLDAALTRLARGARIVLIGGVSQYNAPHASGPSNYLELMAARASMIGMLVEDYADHYASARSELAGWLQDGRLVAREDIRHGGVLAFPEVLLSLFAGENVGKLMLALP